MKLTYFGHSACLLETATHRLLFDPFLSGNPQCPVRPQDVECDYILLTHGHADHARSGFSRVAGNGRVR